MHIDRLDVQGFRCFGPAKTTWVLDKKSWTVVGPANSGKSTLTSALHWTLNAQPTPEDFFGLQSPAQIEISGDFSLNLQESIQLANETIPRFEEREQSLPEGFWQWLARLLFPSISYRRQIRVLDEQGNIENKIHISTPTLIAHPDTNKIRFNHAHQETDRDVEHFIDRAGKLFAENSSAGPDDLLTRLDTENIGTIVTREQLQSTAISLLRDRIRILEEVRIRPNRRQDDSLETWDGLELAGVLGAMSFGDIPQRSRYSTIESLFNTLHQPMELYLRRLENKWEISFKVPEAESLIPSDAVGMGTLQDLLILTNLVASQDRILVVEEPELHLHPPAQHSLAEAFATARDRNQVIVITHSPHILGATEDFQILRLSSTDRPSNLNATNPTLLASVQPVWVREYLKTALFGRVTLLVEGPYDLLTMENLFGKLVPSWKAQGINIVPVGGKKSIVHPTRFLEDAHVRVFVCVDDDALSDPDDHWNHDGNRFPISAVLKQALEIGKLDQNAIDQLTSGNNDIGLQTNPSKKFFNHWRNELWQKGWFVLSDKLDYLVLKAAGEKIVGRKGSSENKRRAEAISRTMPISQMPQELIEMAAMITESQTIVRAP